MSHAQPKAALSLARAVARGLWRRATRPARAPHEAPVQVAGIKTAVPFPEYFLHAFHGQPNGYLSDESAAIYDLGLWAYFLGQERRVRASLLDRLPHAPRRALDLGCGAGASSFALAERFTACEIEAVDLSPHMLAEAQRRAALSPYAARLRFSQHNAEALASFPDASFDLVTSSFLHHEVPREANRAIFREAARLLPPGGVFAILDEPQREDTRLVDFVPGLVGEPHYASYARMSFPEELSQAGFVGLQLVPGLATKTILARRS